MNKKTSLKDIAQQVGVSTALVSYVLSGKEKEARVGQEIANVIRETAKRLNYQPNHIAKSLKSGKSYTIGLIVADISNPFFAHIARTIEDEAKKEGYTTIFGSSDEQADKSNDLIHALVNRQVDGFIIAPAADSEKQITYLHSHQIPFVLIDRYFPDIPSNYVVIDNYRAAYEATQHLITRGFKRIAMVAYDNQLIHMSERVRGYQEALLDNGLSLEPSRLRKIDFNYVKDGIKGNIEGLLAADPPVDAIFFATNTLSVQGVRYLNSRNYRIPEDIGLVCFDENDSFDFFYCAITCVSQPLVQVAREAVHILMDNIRDKNSEKKQLMLPADLIIRKSCGT